MRTTLTIDDDLMQALRSRAVKEGLSLKETVNRVLRVGVKAIGLQSGNIPYRCPTFSLGYPPKADINHALDLADKLESEEISRKLELRK